MAWCFPSQPTIVIAILDAVLQWFFPWRRHNFQMEYKTGSAKRKTEGKQKKIHLTCENENVYSMQSVAMLLPYQLASGVQSGLCCMYYVQINSDNNNNDDNDNSTEQQQLIRSTPVVWTSWLATFYSYTTLSLIIYRVSL